METALRIVVVAPDLSVSDPQDDYAINQAERSRSLRIGLLESGFNLVAVASCPDIGLGLVRAALQPVPLSA